MLPTIDLDDEARFQTRKVDNAVIDRYLASEPVAFDLFFAQ